MKRNLGALAALLAVAGVLVSASPPASAAPAPWTWVRVTQQVSVAPNTNYAERAYCPAGYTAITGGLKLPTGSQLSRRADYRAADGSFWQVNFRNSSSSSGSRRSSPSARGPRTCQSSAIEGSSSPAVAATSTGPSVA